MNALGWPAHRPDTEIERAFQKAKLASLKMLPVELEHEPVRWPEAYGEDSHRKKLKEEARSVCRRFGHTLSSKKKLKFWFDDVTPGHQR